MILSSRLVVQYMVGRVNNEEVTFKTITPHCGGQWFTYEAITHQWFSGSGCDQWFTRMVNCKTIGVVICGAIRHPSVGGQ